MLSGATLLLRGLLFGVNPWDVKIMLSVVCVLVASFFVASYFPPAARRPSTLRIPYGRSKSLRAHGCRAKA